MITGTFFEPVPSSVSHMQIDTQENQQEALTIGISIVTLFVAFLAVRVSWKIQQRNEKHLRYSFWLNKHIHFRDQLIENKALTSKEGRNVYVDITKKIERIKEKFEKDFPDPAE